MSVSYITTNHKAMNEINEIINTDKAACREFDAAELMHVLVHSMGMPVFWSWGASNFSVDKKPESTMFIMKVNGRHFKGHVCIFLMAWTYMMFTLSIRTELLLTVPLRWDCTLTS
jgi:hypothetical protein